MLYYDRNDKNKGTYPAKSSSRKKIHDLLLLRIESTAIILSI